MLIFIIYTRTAVNVSTVVYVMISLKTAQSVTAVSSNSQPREQLAKRVNNARLSLHEDLVFFQG